jgi:small-conductance mechanosensitive channel
MKKIFLILLVLCVLCVTPFAHAQDNTQPANTQTVQQENIKQLIETLESDTARQELISSLQLLLDQQQKNQQDQAGELLPTLTEQIGVRGKISQLVKQYEKFLDRNAISSSTVRQSAGTIIVLFLGSILLFITRKLSRKLIKMLNDISHRAGMKLSRIAFYTRSIQWILRIFLLGMVTYTIAKIWEIEEVAAFFESMTMRTFLTTSVTVIIVAVIAATIWESVGIYLAYILKRADERNHTRIKTLLPIIRNIVLSLFGMLFGLVIMSELGLNVAPFLAGAGVIGVAIGFGAQTMVKDFITGFIIVIEDVIRVGDVATLGGCSGVIEKITLRKVQLRDFAGSVYTIPYSEIKTVQNMTKDFSFYVMDVGVSYSQNTDKVIEVLRAVDKDLRTDPAFSNLILAPIEVVGVDRFADSAVIIKARIKTRPIKQWDVGREFNRRMKIAFDKNGIEIPFPQRVVTVRSEENIAVTAAVE